MSGGVVGLSFRQLSDGGFMANDFDIGEQRRTWDMDLRPTPPDEYAELDVVSIDRGGLRLLPVFSGEKFRELVAYPIIVERWAIKGCGRGKRRWLAEFTAVERKKISKYYGRFYRWYLVSGTPDRVSMRLSTLELLQRAVAWFARC